ncbi:MAG: hypothetical protein IJS20_06230 [Bacteroidales bacterium]|nr:hypothetical protein [Bacteroidales bacterium]
MSGGEFLHHELKWKEVCGRMVKLVANSGGNKGKLERLGKAICHSFRQHDVWANRNKMGRNVLAAHVTYRNVRA